MGALPKLVAALWLIVGGVWLAGSELFALLRGQPFDSLHLAGGIALLVGGILFGAFLLRQLDTTTAVIEED